MDTSPPRHTRSEATRLLCAGSYLSPDFRRQVVDELVAHEERTVAPSLGVDVLPVLGHALRARRLEAVAAVALLTAWAVFLTADREPLLSVPDAFQAFLPFGLFAAVNEYSPWACWYAVVCLGMLLARYVSGLPLASYMGAPLLSGFRKLGLMRRVFGIALTLLSWAHGAVYWFSALILWRGGPVAVVCPLLIACVVWAHRVRVTRILRSELSRETFAHRHEESRGVRLPDTARYRRLRRFILREQHAPGSVYNPQLPFIGAGTPHQPWSLALELQHSGEHGAVGEGERALPTQSTGTDSALTPRHVIDLITPRLASLRAAAARTGRDRLKDLEVQEFVYLPAGVPRSSDVVFWPEQLQQHLDDAVNEGAEARRHFLRIRVGAWDEQIVVTVFVRVHTQGGMLILEVAPHVLGPIREDFAEVDAVAARSGAVRDVPRTVLRALTLGPSTSMAARDWPSELVRSVFAAPSVAPATGISALWTVVMVLRTWLLEPEHATPGAPVKSVREMGSAAVSSLFQEMDVSRYVKTVQDRIASGVRDALEQRGYRTDRFEQQIVNVGEGGLFIGEMNGGTALGQVTGGAVATGERGRARSAAANAAKDRRVAQ
ncbi:hypothetical protein DTL70_27700 [Streptomyces diacarni]|uniref:Uncharacterized protein n=1 Tax=Streptomyces diacarni TaxID=2800381 RepID=A0A367EH30_9ACTN|nr:hypothetical protein [Streptomyces diacarni]RCG17351.1 hypothetical protein DTL70_27700 [Streptomyces diacarni]